MDITKITKFAPVFSAKHNNSKIQLNKSNKFQPYNKRRAF